jgi:hypothetical protein
MMNGLNKKMAMVCALSMSAFLVSCGAKDSDKVGEAQLCLDSATQATAAACMEKISGIETTSASLLRCSAGFITEGFTSATRFNSAFAALSNGTSNSTEGFLGVLAFNSKSTADLNVTFANETYEHCAKSKAKGFMLLGSMAKTATVLSKLAGTFTSGTQPSETDIANALATAGPTEKAAIGAAVITTYTASCQTGQVSNAQLCTDFNAALTGVDTTDSAAVGAAVVSYWQSH